ncbi:MAG: hypothetical protein JNG86_15175, partial [Verrucomicrobiaceae bacterium]|nr:hypothetical protein [Verrucomicrobiaceae bacterium]
MFGILDSFALSNLIADEVASGVGIVPLLGAGVSAASGIPLVSQLPLHLTLCIGKALGLDGKPEADGVFWHPRFGPWPAIRNDWVERAHLCQQRILAAAECRMVPGMQFDEEQWQSANNYLRAVTIARGSIGDWRLALQFLARLRPTRAKAWNDSHEIAQTCKESLGEVLFHQANSCHREGHAGFVKRLQRIIHLN